MFNFSSSHYEILADVISHKYRSAIIPKYSRKRFENRLFVCGSNISCAGKVSFYNCTFTITANLNKVDYEKAIEAHSHGNHVEIVGDITNSGKKNATITCESFAILD